MKNYALFKATVVDIDMGELMSGITLKSGKRLFSVLMPTCDVIKGDLETGKDAFCLMSGKDILVFRDIRYVLNHLNKHNPITEFSVL